MLIGDFENTGNIATQIPYKMTTLFAFCIASTSPFYKDHCRGMQEQVHVFSRERTWTNAGELVSLFPTQPSHRRNAPHVVVANSSPGQGPPSLRQTSSISDLAKLHPNIEPLPPTGIASRASRPYRDILTKPSGETTWSKFFSHQTPLLTQQTFAATRKQRQALHPSYCTAKGPRRQRTNKHLADPAPKDFRDPGTTYPTNELCPIYIPLPEHNRSKP